MQYLRTRLVSEPEWLLAHKKIGSIYFIRDVEHDRVKVGYSRDPWKRLQTLQVGSSGRLVLMGVIAAAAEIEKHVHHQLSEGRLHGEWFLDHTIVTEWLMAMTQGEPFCRHVWELVPGREVFWVWHEETKSHTKHVLNPDTAQWEPPIK
jgi:hypothetical protein